jgi:hypothetical protein
VKNVRDRMRFEAWSAVWCTYTDGWSTRLTEKSAADLVRVTVRWHQ